MTRPEPENIVRAHNSAKEHRDLDAAAALLDPDVLSYDPSFPEPVKGREACRKASEVLTQIPDLKIVILNMISKGDDVAAEMVTTFGMPPTGRRVELRYAKFFRINRKGLIAEEREYSDSAEKEKQLGQTAYEAFLSQTDASTKSGVPSVG